MKKILTILAATAFMLFLLIGYSTGVSSDLSESIVRLHVLANSDSEDDQTLKLKVRDAILEQSRDNFTKKDDVKNHLQSYKETAERVIAENGYSYPVSVEYGNFEFCAGNLRFKTFYSPGEVIDMKWLEELIGYPHYIINQYQVQDAFATKRAEVQTSALFSLFY